MLANLGATCTLFSNGGMEDWHFSTKTVSSRASYILHTGLFGDVVFLVGAGENAERITAHRLILAMGSPVFEAMFFGSLSETTSEISIPDVTPVAFNSMLQYLYTDHVEVSSLEEAMQISYVARKYMIPTLAEKSEEIMRKKDILSLENVCQVYDFALCADMNDVLYNCLKLIDTESERVFQTDSFVDISLSTLKSIVNRETLFVTSEVVVSDAVLRWGRATCNRADLDSQADLRAVLSSVIPYIRFLAMTPEQFLSSIENGFPLSQEEICAILIRMCKPNSKLLKFPEGICQTAEPRLCKDYYNYQLVSQTLPGLYSLSSGDKVHIELQVTKGVIFICGVKLFFNSRKEGFELFAKVVVEERHSKHSCTAESRFYSGSKSYQINFSKPLALQKGGEADITVHFSETFGVTCHAANRIKTVFESSEASFRINMSSKTHENRCDLLGVEELLFYL